MKMKITQYGYKNDEYADTLTEAGEGGWGNHLEKAGCALTDKAVATLGLTKADHGAKLRIEFGDWIATGNGVSVFKTSGIIYVRFWEDRAPEDEPRLDLYQPDGFVKNLPDYANVTVIPDTGSTPANPL